jgi:hypothetical protein
MWLGTALYAPVTESFGLGGMLGVPVLWPRTSEVQAEDDGMHAPSVGLHGSAVGRVRFGDSPVSGLLAAGVQWYPGLSQRYRNVLFVASVGLQAEVAP